jgi:hypothetical protein
MANLHLEQKDGYVMGHELGEGKFKFPPVTCNFKVIQINELFSVYASFYSQFKFGEGLYYMTVKYWNYDYAKNFRVPQSAAEAVRKGFDHSKTTEGVEYWKGVMDELENKTID